MQNQTKTFANLSEARGFAGRQGILSFESYKVCQDGKCTLTWRVLQLSPFVVGDQGLTSGRRYAVMRETEHAYLFRNDDNKVIKVNRYTMMGGQSRFTTH